MAERVSQTVLQVAAQTTSNERVSQAVLQVAAQTTSNERVSQAVLQVAAQTTSNERVSQTILQVGAVPSYQNSVVAASHNNAGVATSSITFPKPTGTSNKDLLIAVVAFKGDPGSSHITVPSGFSQILYVPSTVTPGSMGVYYKYAKGNEPSTYTFSWSGGNQIASGGVLTLTGPTLNAPIGNTAIDVETVNTNNPLTVTLNPITNYSTIIEIFGWIGIQTFTAPIGPWSQQFIDSNAAGMSTALSARNWDTGTTIQQTGTLSGSPSAYITVSIEVQGAVVFIPPGKKKNPIITNEGSAHALVGSKIIADQVIFNYKKVNTLYNRMKRIGFPRKQITPKTLIAAPIKLNTTIAIAKKRLKLLVTSSVILSAKLHNSVIKSLSSGIIVSSSLTKQLTKTLNSLIGISTKLAKTRFVNLITNIITILSSLVHGPSQLLTASVGVNSSTELLKSIGMNLSASRINLTSNLLKVITAILSTITVISSNQIKQISKLLKTNIITISAGLVFGPAILLEAVVDVGLGSILTKIINPILITTVDLSSDLNQFISKILTSTVSLIILTIKSITNSLNITIVNNTSILFKNLIINLISDLILLMATLSDSGSAITIFLVTSITVTASILKQIIQMLISNFIIFINTVKSSITIMLISTVITNSIISKTVGKIIKGLIRLRAILPGQHIPPIYTLYMPLHNSETIKIYMPISVTKLLYMSLNPNTNSGILIDI